MTVFRRIDRIVTPSPLGPGFAGPRHKARLMIPPGDFKGTNPFFLMADDRTDIGGEFGEAHPHAGIETVTFMLSGSFEDFEGRLDPVMDADRRAAGAGQLVEPGWQHRARSGDADVRAQRRERKDVGARDAAVGDVAADRDHEPGETPLVRADRRAIEQGLRRVLVGAVAGVDGHRRSHHDYDDCHLAGGDP